MSMFARTLPDPFDPVRDAGGVDVAEKGVTDMTTAARWLAGEDIGSSERSYHVPARPYKTEPWVRKAIATITGCAASVPMMITTLDGDIIADGALIDFFDSPAVREGPRGLVAQYLGHYLLSAEAHLVFGLKSPRDNTLDVFGAYSMTSLVSEDGYDLLGWEAKLKDKHGRDRKYPLDRQSVETWTDFNLYPDTRFRGLSRLESLKITLAESESAAEHNATLLARGGGPKGLLKTEQTLTPEQADSIEQRWRNKYAGTGNTGKTAVLGHGTSWESIAQSNKDLLIIDSRKMGRDTILSLYDVPLAVAGVETDQAKTGKANNSAREGFWVNTVWPLLTAVGENFTRAFVPRFGGRLGRKGFTHTRGKAYRGIDYRAAVARAPKDAEIIIWFDMHQVPALRAWHWSQADTLASLVGIGVPLNEAIEKLDLPFTPDKAWGNTWWVKSGMLPAESVMENADKIAAAQGQPKQPAEPKQDPKQDKPDGSDDSGSGSSKGVQEAAEAARKLAADADQVWRAYVNSWSGLERETKSAVEKFWFGQRSRILKRLEDMAGKGSGVLATDKGAEDILPDLVSENGMLVDVMQPHIKSGLSLGGEQIAKEVGGENPFALDDEYFQQFLPERFSNITLTINPTTYDDLRGILAESQQVGESLSQIADRVKGYYRGQIDVGRSLTIARTETAGSLSQGRRAAMAANGVKGKGWLSAMDEHTREAHYVAGQTYGDKGIPLTEHFIVGGEALDHPNDPRGSAKNVINCRCVLIKADVGKSLREVIDWYLANGFVEWRKQNAS